MKDSRAFHHLRRFKVVLYGLRDNPSRRTMGTKITSSAISKAFTDAVKWALEDYGAPTQTEVAEKLSGLLAARERGAGVKKGDRRGVHQSNIAETLALYRKGGGERSSSTQLFDVCLAVGLAPVFLPRQLAEAMEIDYCPERDAAGMAKWMVAAIDAAMKQAGLNQTTAAAAAGLAQPHMNRFMSNYKAGEPPRPARRLFELVDGFELTLSLVPVGEFQAVLAAADEVRKAQVASHEAERALANEKRIAQHLEALQEWEAGEDAAWLKTIRGNAKLTLEQIAKIRGSDETIEALARKLEVAKSTVSYVRNGISWPDGFPEVEPPAP